MCSSDLWRWYATAGTATPRYTATWHTTATTRSTAAAHAATAARVVFRRLQRRVGKLRIHRHSSLAFTERQRVHGAHDPHRFHARFLLRPILRDRINHRERRPPWREADHRPSPVVRHRFGNHGLRLSDRRTRGPHQLGGVGGRLRQAGRPLVHGVQTRDRRVGGRTPPPPSNDTVQLARESHHDLCGLLLQLRPGLRTLFNVGRIDGLVQHRADLLMSPRRPVARPAVVATRITATAKQTGDRSDGVTRELLYFVHDTARSTLRPIDDVASEILSAV